MFALAAPEILTTGSGHGSGRRSRIPKHSSRGSSSNLPLYRFGYRSTILPHIPLKNSSAILLVIAVLFGAACDGSPTVLQTPGIRFEHTAPVVQQAVALLDAHRVAQGCEPLNWHMQGAWVGEMYARQMSDEGFFGHVDTLGRNLKFRLTSAGINRYRTAAETIAAGQATGDRVVASWLASPDHREILEDCRYTHIGLGFHRGAGPYREYWTAVFLNIR